MMQPLHNSFILLREMISEIAAITHLSGDLDHENGAGGV